MLTFGTALTGACTQVPAGSPTAWAGEVWASLGGRLYERATHLVVCDGDQFRGILRIEEALVAPAEARCTPSWMTIRQWSRRASIRPSRLAGSVPLRVGPGGGGCIGALCRPHPLPAPILTLLRQCPGISSDMDSREPFASVFGQYVGVEGSIVRVPDDHSSCFLSSIISVILAHLSWSNRVRRLRVRRPHTTRMRTLHGTAGR
jgi:hypothetical protein